tara:strand:+ start:715 stop:1443 length:729 start_codon:yes stop_codon:yes gene_type:complete
MKLRVIVKVVIFEGFAYQTNQFNKNIYLGDPINICNILSDQGCQELILCFVKSAPSPQFVYDVLSVCRSPVSIGGFGETNQDFFDVISNGAEKLILSDSLWNKSDKSKLLSDRFGSQAVAASIDYIEYDNKRFIVTGKSRNKRVGLLEDFLPKINLSNFGEIILNNITRDGACVGLDYNVLKIVTKYVNNLPVILSGGYNNDDINQVSKLPDGFISGTYFSLNGIKKAPLVYYSNKFSMNNK